MKTCSTLQVPEAWLRELQSQQSLPWEGDTFTPPASYKTFLEISSFSALEILSYIILIIGELKVENSQSLNMTVASQQVDHIQIGSRRGPLEKLAFLKQSCG